MAALTYCLDSWALLAWLLDERPAADRIRAVMPAAPVMSWVNLGEVYYILARRYGHERAGQAIEDVRRSVRHQPVGRAQALAAAAIKAGHPMSYADAFAVATAIEHDAVLLTGDPEILDAAGDWEVEDLR